MSDRFPARFELINFMELCDQFFRLTSYHGILKESHQAILGQGERIQTWSRANQILYYDNAPLTFLVSIYKILAKKLVWISL